MSTLYKIVRESVAEAETDLVQGKQERVLRWVTGITSFKNQAKQFSSRVEIVRKVAFLV